MAKIVNLPKIFDKRGNLSFIEGRNHLPFEIRRTYWIYDVPGGEVRGIEALVQGDLVGQGQGLLLIPGAQQVADLAYSSGDSVSIVRITAFTFRK